jgi:uncharacterized membrane protein HdeD (DUF308 family)
VRIQFGFRAAISFTLGIFITFSQVHSADLGLKVLGVYGILLGIGGAVIALYKRSGLNPLQELPSAALALLIGLFALLSTTSPSSEIVAFLALVSAWGLISGAFELYQSRRLGFKSVRGRDCLISAVLGLLLGVIFLAAPLDAVSAVGFFGAYLAISGVHLGIASSSAK